VFHHFLLLLSIARKRKTAAKGDTPATVFTLIASFLINFHLVF
jgi:hypothetical protein